MSFIAAALRIAINEIAHCTTCAGLVCERNKSSKIIAMGGKPQSYLDDYLLSLFWFLFGL